MASDRDDRWDDGDDRDDRPMGRPPVDVRSKVLGPAIGLMITGVIAVGLAVAGLAFQDGSSIDESFDEQIKKFEEDPNLTAEQKKQQVEMMNNLRGPIKSLQYPSLILYAVCGLVCIFGGYKMMKISGGRAWPMTASIIAMIPCTVCYAFCLGLPIGIWSLIVLSNPDVKAAFARSASPGRGGDEGWSADR